MYNIYVRIECFTVMLSNVCVLCGNTIHVVQVLSQRQTKMGVANGDGREKHKPPPSCCGRDYLNDSLLLDGRSVPRTFPYCIISCSADGQGHLMEYHVPWAEGVLDCT